MPANRFGHDAIHLIDGQIARFEGIGTGKSRAKDCGLGGDGSACDADQVMMRIEEGGAGIGEVGVVLLGASSGGQVGVGIDEEEGDAIAGVLLLSIAY